MTTLRCTARLLKRLRQPVKPPEPPPAANPLGEWYADIDFLDREPFVVMLNAATGAALVVPGRAADLRELHANAGQQLFTVLEHYGFDCARPFVAAELLAWKSPPAYAATRDRSVLGTLRRVKEEAWDHFAYFNRSLPEAASRQWEGLYSHPSLPRHPLGGKYWRPLELVATRLMPGAIVVESVRERPE